MLDLLDILIHLASVKDTREQVRLSLILLIAGGAGWLLIWSTSGEAEVFWWVLIIAGAFTIPALIRAISGRASS